MRELAVVVNSNENKIGPMETIDAIKKAGFKNVFIQWYDKDWHPTQEEQLDYVKKNNLNIIFAHLGYQNINDLWRDNEEGSKIVDRYKKDIKDCKDNGISMVVMHVVKKRDLAEYNELGLKRIQELADYAKSQGVKIAFENTNVKGYLEYVIKNIKNDNVGICFDCGHYHVHFNDEFDFPLFKNRIFAVHLHDNDQSDDQHLLPFDGTLDWEKVIKNLKECNYNGPITLELCYRNDYMEMSPEDFYKKGYEIGEKLQEMFESKETL